MAQLDTAIEHSSYIYRLRVDENSTIQFELQMEKKSTKSW